MDIVTNTIPLLSPRTGVGNYIYNLLPEFHRLRPDYCYHYYYGYFTKTLKLHGDSKAFYIKELLKKTPLLSFLARSLKNDLARLQSRGRFDVYFEPNFIPLDIRAERTVTTVHDFSIHLHPEWHPKERVEYFSRNFFRRIGRSDVIVTDSKYIEGEALEILEGNPRIVTIYLGYNSMVFNTVQNQETKAGIPANYILFVGSIEPRKNLVSLLKAYAFLPREIRKGYKLLLAGFEGWKNKEFFLLLDKLKGSVEYRGYVDDETLAGLYRNATCFVYPSLYEGFGLPPLEAMACGCPVVVSNVASLPEVCGDAAHYVDPHDVEGIAEGMYKVLTDNALRQSLIQKGLERARLFSWEKSAREHLKVFEEVLNA